MTSLIDVLSRNKSFMMDIDREVLAVNPKPLNPIKYIGEHEPLSIPPMDEKAIQEMARVLEKEWDRRRPPSRAEIDLDKYCYDKDSPRYTEVAYSAECQECGRLRIFFTFIADYMCRDCRNCQT